MPGGNRRDNFVTYHKIISLMETTKAISGRRAKWGRPVSRKFYESLRGLIRRAATLSDEVREGYFIRCIDDYIDSHTVATDLSSTERVVFALLQPQIDKAMERSRRARAAARHRRVAVESQDASRQEPTLQTQPSADARTICEEKRALRREAARQRRIAKHRKRLARRAACSVQNSGRGEPLLDLSTRVQPSTS